MIRIFSLLLITILLFSSCKPDDRDSRDTAPRVITPRSDDANESADSETKGESADTNFLVPMIDIPENEYVQKIQDSNLDDDSEEEQIILTRVNIDGKDILRLYIADYDNDNVRYYRALVHDINAQHMEGLSIHLQDLTGNQLNELYITGFTDGGFHTIDAFAIASLSQGLQYRLILSLNVNGTVDIQTKGRSESYESGAKTGESFPIITEETSTEDDDNLDLVKTIYNWSSSARRYQPFSVAKIPGVTIKEENLKKLYRGDLIGFKTFLTGPWHRVLDLNRQEQPFLKEILYFYPDEDQLIFTVDDVQEIYSWKDTYRTIFKGIYIQSTNSLINSIRRDIYITVEDMDSIRMKIQGTTEWGGYYEPVSPTLQQELIRLDKLETIDELTNLSGLFKGSRGNEIYLDFPYFTEKNADGETEKGVLAFFDLYGTSVMEMRYQKENGLLARRAVYRATFNETGDSTRIIRTLSLEPGSLSVSGFTREPGEVVHLEQVEIRESEES